MSVSEHSPNALGQSPGRRNAFAALTLGSIGVVYGDIGTSPLYALREALHNASEGGITPDEVIGVVSLLIWTLTIVVTLKYVVLILRADNNGEGGVLSLLALAQRYAPAWAPILAVGIVAASLFYGDAIITPAISVLSAMEGLKLVSPVFEAYVLPLTLAILTALFAVQAYGTARLASLFGPITLVWFVVMGGLGLFHIGDNPAILHALNPLSAVSFVVEHGLVALLVLGSVFLAITGAEALYADLGHFGRGPIRLAWGSVVFPALALNYLGQGGLILANPAAIDNPFFLLAPEWLLLPLVLLATMATIIAAQAVITGAFSLTHQAIQLGLLPRMEVRHTSSDHVGQIYIPKVNAWLYVGVVALVLFFQTSSGLAGAYGIAVAGNMLATSILAAFVFHRVWKWPLWRCALVIAPFMAIELVFLSSNLLKLFSGGYVPLALSLVLSVLMWTFVRGTRIVQAKSAREAIGLKELCGMLERSKPQTARGTAIFMTSEPDLAPNSLMHNLKHNGVLHEQNLILTVRTDNRPRVSPEERLTITPVNDRFKRVTVAFGYMEEPNIVSALALGKKQGLKFEIMATSFFLSRRSLRALPHTGMPRWQDRLYMILYRSVADATEFYRLPTNRVVEMGQQLAI